MTPQPPSPVVRVVTVTAVVVVAVIAAVVSFAHMYGVAHSHGEQWRSWLIPVSIDGLVVAASMVLVTRRRAQLAGGWLAWTALGAGVLASLAANIADAQPNVTARLLAGWPAVAFAVAFELLLQQRRAERPDKPVPQPVQLPVPAGGPVPVLHRPLPPPPVVARATPAVQPIPHEHEQETPSWAPTPTDTSLPSSTTPAVTPSPGSAPANANTSKPAGGSSPSTAVSGGASTARTPAPRVPKPSRVTKPAPPADGDLVAQVRQLIAEAGGRTPGRRTVAKQLGVSEHTARRALDELVTTGTPASNGTGPAKSTGNGQVTR